MRCANYILRVVILVSGVLFVPCCSKPPSDTREKSITTRSQASNLNEVPNFTNANANVSSYALNEVHPPSSKTVEIPANVQWVDTGVDLRAKQKFMIVASGSWSTGKYTSGPIGTPGECYGCIVPEGSRGELVAMIGKESFVIGDKMQMSAPIDGRLYLSINEFPNQFQDNIGKVSATVTYGSVLR